MNLEWKKSFLELEWKSVQASNFTFILFKVKDKKGNEWGIVLIVTSRYYNNKRFTR